MVNNIWKKGLVFGIILLFIGACVTSNTIKNVSASDGGNTLYVDDNADPSWYDATHVKTIQEGIDNASVGHTVFVYNGIYLENVVVNKTIDLIGEDLDTTIIDGGGNADTVLVSADWVNITGFTIRNSGSEYKDAGMEICSSYNTITGNYISHNYLGLFFTTYSHHNMIKHNNVSFNDAYGIIFYHSNNNTISANEIFSNNWQGIYIQYADSGDNVISNNNITHNNLTGITLNLYADNNIVTGNNVVFNDGGMWVWGTNENLIMDNNISSNNGDGISLSQASNNILQNNTISSNGAEGIDLSSSFDNVIADNHLANNRAGLYLAYSNNNNLTKNTISNNSKYGIYFNYNSSYNIISFNNISGNVQDGIYLKYYNNFNTIFKNTISNNWYALRLWGSCNNTVTQNIFSETNYWAVSLSQSSINNQLYHNNFIGNLNTAWDESPPNSWDNNYPSGGNYWSDYSGTDADGDGIGDVPYDISGGSNQDLYPLINPYCSVTNLDTGEEFLTIQESIDDSDTLSGHIIYVKNGIFIENVVVDKSINLIGEDRNTTIIDGGGNTDTVLVSADWVNITGFTIRNSGSEYKDAGMEICSSYNTITGNYISHNYLGLFFTSYSHHNMIKHNNVSFNDAYGIISFHSNNNTISANDIYSNNWQGIYIQYADSGDNVISNNNITHNNLNAMIINLHADNNTVTGNNILFNGNGGLWFWASTKNLIMDNNICSNSGDGIWLSGSSDNIIKNNTVSLNSADGLEIYQSVNNMVIGNCFTNNYNGVYLWNTNSNNITCNNFSASTKYGIYSYNSSNNTISFNDISDNTKDGIYFMYDNDNNTIYRNTISNNWYALRLWRSSNNIIMQNIFSETNYWAVSLSQSSINNQLYHNNFIGNLNTAWDESPPNSWDNNYPSGGNYWSDYSGTDADGDGIGDVPYDISGGSNQDLYPLMYPWDPLNNPPTIISLNLPVAPVPIGSGVNLTGNFTDLDYLDTHSATINWDDGNITMGNITGSDGFYVVSDSRTFVQTGVYTITLSVTDNNGGSDIEVFQYVVVYNVEGGFVTGGGWIDSPQGAYIPNPNLTGKANFGFVSKYKKGQQNPIGNTEFNFKVADLNFHSDTYDWLVVAGHKAMYKGNGTVNGSGNYGFLISAIDEELTQCTDVDLFRIKIWDKNNDDEVIYDNMLGEDEDEDPTTEISGGNIKIHTGS